MLAYYPLLAERRILDYFTLWGPDFEERVTSRPLSTSLFPTAHNFASPRKFEE
jgi:hypothetical protein